MRQLLFLVLALIGALWWFSRTLGGATRRAGTRPRRDASPRAGGDMVRDRVCNTFLPRERALVTQIGAEEHYFCSERCRDTFLAAHDG